MSVASDDRNRLWMSDEIAQIVSAARLVVVGCGGSGVMFVVQAAHVGFRHFTLLDADRLEESNFNRYVIAEPSQIGQFKVDVVEEYLTRRFSEISVRAISKYFPDDEVAACISVTDLVIGCLDDVQPRIELDVLSRKCNKPLLDLGTGFRIDEITGLPAAAGGQVLVSRPGEACLLCMGFDLEGKRHNYFIPQIQRPEPSSLLLNSIVASLAVECGIGELGRYLSPMNRLAYDRGTFSLTKEIVQRKPTCKVCGGNSLEHIANVGEIEQMEAKLMNIGIKCSPG